jgi:putative PEP-CTERM system histidine kinase
MNFLAMRSFLYLVAAALMAYSFACRRGNVRIQVSRQVAFKSLVLFAVGVYLVMLGIMGEGMRHLGVFFPNSVTISLSFVLGISLLLLLLSERFRRRIKVALHKNFYQNKHDYRTQWLCFTEQLSSSGSGDELLKHILSAYCEIFGFRGAALFLFENNRGGYCASSVHEIELRDEVIKADNSLLLFISKYACIISIVSKNSEITEEDSRFFKDGRISFVVPLFSAERLEGFIVLGLPVNDKEVYIYEDFDLMQTIAKQASQAILHQRLSKEITHAREIEAIGHVSTFVVHDLKNLVSNLSLMVENAARYLDNPDFQADMLASLGNTVAKMQKLIGRLNNMGAHEQKINQQQINLLELAESTASLVAGSRLTVSGTAEIVYVDENEIQKVILNLIMNAIESSEPNEIVAIEVGCSNAPFIRVIDKGCGMSADFIRTELFKPFKSTKKKGLGIGLYQCSRIIAAHGGRFEVSSVEGSGSVFTVWFADNGKN